MAVATFDTLKFANTLKAAGVPSQQAEAQAVAFAEVIQINLKDLVTKEDLSRAVEDLKSEIADTRKDAKHDLKETEMRLSGRIEGLAGKFENLTTKFEALTAKFETLTAKTETTPAKLGGTMTLLRWIVGLNATAVFGMVGLALRFFIFRGVP